MTSYLRLSLALLGILLISTHCQEEKALGDLNEEEAAAHAAAHADEMGEGDDEGEEVADEEGGDEDEDDNGEMEKMEALTPEQMHALHKKIDVNDNGKVSLAEVTDFAHKMRHALAKSELDEIMKDQDTDKDGKLSWTEFLGDAGEVTEAEQREKQQEFKELDVNKDNSLEPDELAQMYNHHINEKVETELTNSAMKSRDVDKNGVLSLREFFEHLQVEGEELVEIPADDEEIFTKLDKDGSGTLTLKELKAWESGSFQAEEAVKKIFAKADKNKDNVLTKEEMAEAREELADDKDYEAQMYLTQWAEQHKAEHGEL
jgi:Ca2+-binding EF-hand superfamily protein